MIKILVPVLSVSVSSSSNEVLDIDGYNSFLVQCGGAFKPYFVQPRESFKFTLTRTDNIPVTNVSLSLVMRTGETISQNSSVQQYASMGPTTLVYNCTVCFRIGNSLIAVNSNTTQVTVRGELQCTLHYTFFELVLLGRHGSASLCRDGQENKMADTYNVLAFKR